MAFRINVSKEKERLIIRTHDSFEGGEWRVINLDVETARWLARAILKEVDERTATTSDPPADVGKVKP